MRLAERQLGPCPGVSVRLTLARGPRLPGLLLPCRQGLWSPRSALTGPWDSAVFAKKCMLGFPLLLVLFPPCFRACCCPSSGLSSCRGGSAFSAIRLLCGTHGFHEFEHHEL